MKALLLSYLLFVLATSMCCGQGRVAVSHTLRRPMEFKTKLSAEAWRKKLSEVSYYTLREKGTERAFSGAYWNHKEKGAYCCVGCDAVLFLSKAKFRSGTGWPSFYEPATMKSVYVESDYSYGMIRKEVLCSSCGGHLGHVFTDGPPPTGLRYCINSASLSFKGESQGGERGEKAKGGRNNGERAKGESQRGGEPRERKA